MLVGAILAVFLLAAVYAIGEALEVVRDLRDAAAAPRDEGMVGVPRPRVRPVLHVRPYGTALYAFDRRRQHWIYGIRESALRAWARRLWDETHLGVGA